MRQLQSCDWIEKPWWTADAKMWEESGEPFLILEFDLREERILAYCKQVLRWGHAIPYELHKYGQVAEQELFEKFYDMQDRHRYLIDRQDYRYDILVDYVDCDVGSPDPSSEAKIDSDVSTCLIICKLNHDQAKDF